MENFTAYSRATAPGVLPLPTTQTFTLAQGVNQAHYGHEHNPIKTMLASSDGLTHLFDNDKLSLAYSLMAQDKGVIKKNLALGRIWSPHYPITATFTTGLAAPPHHLEVAPAYAGFKHGLMDTAALSALAAVSAVFQQAPNAPVPDAARSSINVLMKRSAGLNSLFLRGCILYVAAALAECAGGPLTVHSASDDRRPEIVTTFAQYSLVVTRAAAAALQPVPCNLRGLAEQRIYSRVTRVLCLDKPVVAYGSQHAQPSIMDLWPPMNNATALLFGPVEQLTDLAGDVTSSDVAIYLSYIARVFNCKHILEDALSLACGFAMRPAGSGAMGKTPSIVMHMPVSELAPLALMPIVQPIDTLDNEEILFGMDRPLPLLTAGAVRSGVFLAAYNNTAMAIGGDAYLTATGSGRTALAAHLRSCLTKGSSGSALSSAALALCASMGWDNSYSRPWSWVGTNLTILLGNLFPVEVEELLPYVVKLPDTAAVLGTLKPCGMSAPIPVGAFGTVKNITGRVGLTDGHHSLLAVAASPSFHEITSQLGSFPAPRPLAVRSNYRGAPADAQFIDFKIDSYTRTTSFTLPSAAAVLTAMHGYNETATWQWHYSALVAYDCQEVLTQYIQHGSAPQQPPAMPVEDLVTIEPPLRKRMGKPLPEDQGAEVYRDMLGSVWGNVVDAHAAMSAMANKRVARPLYDENSRVLTGAVTGCDVGVIAAMLGDEAIPVIQHFYTMATDAAHWAVSPASAQVCTNVAESAAALYSGMVGNVATCPDPADGTRTPPPPADERSRVEEVSDIAAAHQSDFHTDVPAAPSPQDGNPSLPVPAVKSGSAESVTQPSPRAEAARAPSDSPAVTAQHGPDPASVGTTLGDVQIHHVAFQAPPQ
ncbi:putative capsid protein [Cronartium ribicola totivirus 1]|nr:putative capsid protein [Cronartium ribicola totivirus 1]